MATSILLLRNTQSDDLEQSYDNLCTELLYFQAYKSIQLEILRTRSDAEKITQRQYEVAVNKLEKREYELNRKLSILSEKIERMKSTSAEWKIVTASPALLNLL